MLWIPRPEFLSKIELVVVSFQRRRVLIYEKTIVELNA